MTAITGIQTLCWNCDGEVDVEEALCPYCGVDLQKKEEPCEEPVFEESLEPPEATEYKSPYRTVRPQAEVEPTEWVQEHRLASSLLPMGLLLPGAVFFLFALVLLLFGDEGHFTLSWNTSYWPLYLVLSLPLLYFGWHSLDQVPD